MTEQEHAEMTPGDHAPSDADATGENLCPDCSGSGQAGGGQCETCGGTGKVNEGVGGA